MWYWKRKKVILYYLKRILRKYLLFYGCQAISAVIKSYPDDYFSEKIVEQYITSSEKCLGGNVIGKGIARDSSIWFSDEEV